MNNNIIFTILFIFIIYFKKIDCKKINNPNNYLCKSNMTCNDIKKLHEDPKNKYYEKWLENQININNENCKKMKEYDEKIKYCLRNKKIKKIPDKYILNENKLNKHICNKCKTKINNEALNNICKNY